MAPLATMTFELPWPPSTNRYWRHVGPRVLISREGRLFRQRVVTLLRSSKPPMLGPLKLHAEFYPPDRRRRDLDNVGGKALLDALQAAGLFADDSQIKEIHLQMHEPVPGGLCAVTLSQMEPLP